MKDVLLIVDDEPEIRELLSELVARWGLEPRVAEGVLEALEILQKERITAVLSDIVMPMGGGTQLIKMAREAGYHLPFVFLSGMSQELDVERAKQYGAKEFVEKPFEQERLRAAVFRAIEDGK